MLYVRNLTQDFTEDRLKDTFESHGAIQRVKKIKDYAFIHFEERDDAVRAMEALQGRNIHGSTLEVSLAKPPSDRKKKEEILKARERRLLQQQFVQRGPGVSGAGGLVVPHPQSIPPLAAFRGGAGGSGNRPLSLRAPGTIPSQSAGSGQLPFGRGKG